MNLRFADRMSGIKASEIRELLKLTQQPDIISFAGGLPAPEFFPIDTLKEVAIQVLDKQGHMALQYGPTEGYSLLRQATAERMKKVQAPATAEDILITSGSQQGLDFTAKIFINPGDVIIVERPSYLGALNAFQAYQPTFMDMEIDEDGMDMNALENTLKTTKNVKFIYVIPDFQNPSGKTWSIERRKQLVDLANRYDIVIIEDNPYGELRFEGDFLPSIKHFDTQGRVVFLGTYSKILCPGLRLGWVCASKEILEKYILIKQGSDLQSSTISQIELATFITQYDIEAHISSLREVYGKRRDLMLQTMDDTFPDCVTFTRPKGGLFTWAVLPPHLNSRELAVKALEKKVAYVPGGSFFATGGGENTLRLNYSNMNEEKIVEGISRLGKVIHDAL